MTDASLISPADLQIFENEPRIVDVKLAHALGFKRGTNVRNLIQRNREEIDSFGLIASQRSNYRGREMTVYMLNEHQAILLAILSDAPNAPTVRRALIECFVLFRKGRQSHQAAPAPILTRAEIRQRNIVRSRKMQFAQAAIALDDVGIDVASIDMRTVLNFGRMIVGKSSASNGRA